MRFSQWDALFRSHKDDEKRLKWDEPEWIQIDGIFLAQ